MSTLERVGIGFLILNTLACLTSTVVVKFFSNLFYLEGEKFHHYWI